MKVSWDVVGNAFPPLSISSALRRPAAQTLVVRGISGAYAKSLSSQQLTLPRKLCPSRLPSQPQPAHQQAQGPRSPASDRLGWPVGCLPWDHRASGIFQKMGRPPRPELICLGARVDIATIARDRHVHLSIPDTPREQLDHCYVATLPAMRWINAREA